MMEIIVSNVGRVFYGPSKLGRIELAAWRKAAHVCTSRAYREDIEVLVNGEHVTSYPYVFPGSRATKFLRENASYAYQSGVTVVTDSAFSTVSIETDSGEIFMQGDEAEAFMADVDALCKKYPSLSAEVAEYAKAYEYLDVPC